MDETFVIPVKLRWPSAMFTLREIFYNEKLRLGSNLLPEGKTREKALLRAKA